MPFDPSKPFEQEGVVGFDPSKPFEREEEITKLESGLRGAAQGVTLGFADEIEAGLRSAVSEDSYEDTLTKIRQKYSQAREANPLSYGAGAIGASFVPGGLIAKGIGGAVKAGMAIGGIEAAGASEADSVRELAGDVATGAAIGGVLGKGGELLGKGLEKVGEVAKKGTKAAVQKIDDVAQPTALRESALYKTPSQIEKELLNPKQAQFVQDSVKKAEDLGLFDRTIGKTLGNVQSKLKEVGKELGDTSKDLPDLFKDNLQLTDDVLNTIDNGKLKIKAKILKDLDEAYLSPAEARRSSKIVDDTFSGLVERIDNSKNALESLRQLRIGLSKRLKGADYVTGPKAGTQKEALKRVVDSVRSLEDDVIVAYKQHTQDPAVLSKLDSYSTNMDTYSKLKNLEGMLAKTEGKSSKVFGLEEIAAGAVDPSFAVVPFLRRHLSSSTGKLVAAKSAEKLISVNDFARQLGVSPQNAAKYLSMKRIPIDNGMVTAASLTALRQELKGDK